MILEKTNRLIEYLKGDKKRVFLLVALLIGVLLLVSSFLPGESEAKTVTLDEYKAQLEEELAKLCSSVDGAGKCTVEVTFAEGESFEYHGSSVSASYPPKVLGVAVICEGASIPRVKSDITECMTALFDIGANRVCVLKMDK